MKSCDDQLMSASPPYGTEENRPYLHNHITRTEPTDGDVLVAPNLTLPVERLEWLGVCLVSIE